jgi:hypothetical protein
MGELFAPKKPYPSFDTPHRRCPPDATVSDHHFNIQHIARSPPQRHMPPCAQQVNLNERRTLLPPEILSTLVHFSSSFFPAIMTRTTLDVDRFSRPETHRPSTPRALSSVLICARPSCVAPTAVARMAAPPVIFPMRPSTATSTDLVEPKPVAMRCTGCADRIS